MKSTIKSLAWCIRHPVFAFHWMKYAQPFPYKENLRIQLHMADKEERYPNHNPLITDGLYYDPSIPNYDQSGNVQSFGQWIKKECCDESCNCTVEKWTTPEL